MIDHPTFMYRDNPGNVTQTILTWWVDKEQFAVTNMTMTGDEREVHQTLLEGFVKWCNDRGTVNQTGPQPGSRVSTEQEVG